MRDIETRHRHQRSDWGNDQVSPRQNSFKHQEPTVSRRDDTIETSVPDSFEVGQADVVPPRPNRTFDEPTPRMLVDPNTYTNRRNEINRDQTLAQSQGGISRFDHQTGKSYRQPTPLEVQEHLRGPENMSRGLDQHPPTDADIARKEIGALESDYNATEDTPDYAQLTPAQREVMEYIAQGYSYQEIANMRFVTEKTIRNHIQQAKDRVGAKGKTTTGMVVEAMRKGALFQEPDEHQREKVEDIETPDFRIDHSIDLTADQARALELMARGQTEGAIAVRMGLDEGTVHGLIHSARLRNNYHDSTPSLIIKAIQQGVIRLK